MSELEMLINEKRRLDDRIRLLKEGCSNFGQLENIRFLRKSEAEDDRVWQVSSQMVQTHRERETWEEAEKNGHKYREAKVEYETGRWQVFIREKSREEAIIKMKQIINDLTLVIKTWSEEEKQQ